MTVIKAAIQEIQAQISSLADQEDCFVEVRDNGVETILGGNRMGLLQIALQVLALAEKDIPGSHFQIDQHSLADVAERPLVVRRAPVAEA